MSFWWEQFLKNQEAIFSLPDNELESMCYSSSKELEKMEEQKKNLQQLIKTLSLKYCDSIEETQSSDTIPLGKRYKELTITIENLKYDICYLENEINAKEILVSQLTNTKDSNKRKPNLSKLFSKISSIALSTTNEEERNNCILSIDFLSGNTKFLASMVQKNNSYFQKASKELSYSTALLNSQFANIMTEISSLNKILENTKQKNEDLHQKIPKMKAQLQAEIKQFGDTQTKQFESEKIVAKLTTKRDKLLNQITDLSSKLISKLNTKNEINEKEIDEISQLKQKKLELKMMKNEIIQQNKVLESQIESIEDEIKEIKESNKTKKRKS